jgi:hypothetical protein
MSYPTEQSPQSNAPEPQQPTVSYGAAEHPWTVTSAAVIAFVLAALWLLTAIFEFVLAAAFHFHSTAYLRSLAGIAQFFTRLSYIGFNSSLRYPEMYVVFTGLLYAVFAALLIWCGVRALRGSSGRSLFVAAVAIIAVNIILTGSATGINAGLSAWGDILGFHWGTVVFVVLPVIIIGFLLQKSSRQFFGGRGGTGI